MISNAGFKHVSYTNLTGGAVAIHTASKVSNEIKGCIVENTFLSIPELVNGLGPGFIQNRLYYLKYLLI